MVIPQAVLDSRFRVRGVKNLAWSTPQFFR